MVVLGQAVVSGILLGLFYALLAAGFSLVFGVVRVFNLAHGEFVVLGGYLSYGLWNWVGLNPFLAVPVSAVGMAFVGLLLQPVVRRIGEPFELNALVFTFGLSLALQSLMLNLWTANYRLVPMLALESSLVWGGVSLSLSRLAVALFSLGSLGGLAILLGRTYLGKAMRATSQDRDGALLMGIDVESTDRWALAIGAGLAGAAGPLFLLLRYLSPSAGLNVTVVGLILVILGGVGKTSGVLAGGLLLGVVESVTIGLWGAQWREFVSFALLLTLLRTRATGLLEGRRY